MSCGGAHCRAPIVARIAETSRGRYSCSARSGWSATYCWIAERSAWFGTSCAWSSGAPVSGDVDCPPRNHSVIASRSYEKPSDVETGSAMSSAVMGQVKESGTVRDMVGVSCGLAQRATNCGARQPSACRGAPPDH